MCQIESQRNSSLDSLVDAVAASDRARPDRAIVGKRRVARLASMAPVGVETQLARSPHEIEPVPHVVTKHFPVSAATLRSNLNRSGRLSPIQRS